VAAGKVAVCNSSYSGKYGRVNNPPPGAPNPYVDWSEDGLQGNKYTNYQPCQVSFGHSTQLLDFRGSHKFEHQFAREIGAARCRIRVRGGRGWGRDRSGNHCCQ